MFMLLFRVYNFLYRKVYKFNIPSVYTVSLERMTPPCVVPLLPKVKRSLADFLDRYRGETTNGKMVLMGQLREYVRRQDPWIVKDEVSMVTDEQDLNVLLGVGMKGFLYYEVIKQKAKSVGM